MTDQFSKSNLNIKSKPPSKNAHGITKDQSQQHSQDEIRRILVKQERYEREITK